MSTTNVANGLTTVNREPVPQPALRIVGWRTRVQLTLEITAPTGPAALALAAQLVGGDEVIEGVDQLTVRGQTITLAGAFECEVQPEEITRLITVVSRHQFTGGAQ